MYLYPESIKMSLTDFNVNSIFIILLFFYKRMTNDEKRKAINDEPHN